MWLLKSEDVIKEVMREPVLNIDPYYWLFEEGESCRFYNISAEDGFVKVAASKYDFDRDKDYVAFSLLQNNSTCKIDEEIDKLASQKPGDMKYVISVSAYGDPLENRNFESGFYKYRKKCEAYSDKDIKRLEESYADLVSIFADQFRYADKHSSEEADCVYYWFDRYDTNKAQLYGIFDGEMPCGVIDVYYFEEYGLVMINNLLVGYEYRRQGVASRLLKAMMGMYPDKTCVFYADFENEPAQNLLASLGFEKFAFWGTMELGYEEN